VLAEKKKNKIKQKKKCQIAEQPVWGIKAESNTKKASKTEGSKRQIMLLLMLLLLVLPPCDIVLPSHSLFSRTPTPSKNPIPHPNPNTPPD